MPIFMILKGNVTKFQKISIITVVFNNLDGMRSTLKSIKAAKDFYRNFIIEWIVVDGCSSDGTSEFLESNRSVIAELIIENDRGLYDGMNKGIGLAGGELLLFLNSGDSLLLCEDIDDCFPLGLDKVHIFNVDVSGKDMYFPVLRESVFFLRMPCHQGMVVPRLIEGKLVFYDLSFPINADLDYKIVLFNKLGFTYRNMKIAHLEKWGISQNYDSALAPLKIAYREARLALKHNGIFSAFLNFILRVVWHSLKLLRLKSQKSNSVNS